MCQMESKLTNGLAFIFLSFSVLPDDTHDEKLLLKVDATETEPYLAMCHMTKSAMERIRRMKVMMMVMMIAMMTMKMTMTKIEIRSCIRIDD